MKLLIPIEKGKYYIYSKVIPKLKGYIISNLDKKRVDYLSKELNVKVSELIKFFIKNIIVIKSSSNYIITFDKTKKFNNKDLFYWLNLINYGSLSVKGYPIILEAFSRVRRSLDVN